MYSYNSSINFPYTLVILLILHIVVSIYLKRKPKIAIVALVAVMLVSIYQFITLDRSMISVESVGFEHNFDMYEFKESEFINGVHTINLSGLSYDEPMTPDEIDEFFEKSENDIYEMKATAELHQLYSESDGISDPIDHIRKIYLFSNSQKELGIRDKMLDLYDNYKKSWEEFKNKENL